MARDWREVKEEIEQEVERIWYEEPVEVTMSKKGIFPSNAILRQYVLPCLRYAGYGLVDL